MVLHLLSLIRHIGYHEVTENDACHEICRGIESSNKESVLMAVNRETPPPQDEDKDITSKVHWTRNEKARSGHNSKERREKSKRKTEGNFRKHNKMDWAVRNS